jgi:signal recognition particle receptor subunit alpha
MLGALSFHVFSRGGLTLFSNGKLENNALNRLVCEHLLEERPSPDFVAGPYSLKWRMDNQAELVYVVATPTVLGLKHTDDLLDRLYRHCSAIVGKNVEASYDFEADFQKLSRKAERKAETAKEARSFDEVRAVASSATPPTPASPAAAVAKEQSSDDEPPSPSMLSSSGETGGALSQEEIKRRVLAKRGGAKKPSAKAAASPPAKTAKVARTWEGGDKKMSKQQEKELNKSKDGDVDMSASVAAGSQRVAAYNLDLEVSSDEDEVLEESGGNNNNNGDEPKRGFFGNLFRGLTGRTLDKGDLDPVLAHLQDHLIKKNVASDVSAQLCSSVQSSLLGKQLGSLASVSKLVNEALRVALVKILTPKRNIDILVDVETANRAGRPFTIVFVGINGVGKSTNLAKVASWLLSNKKKVLIAACDTFRSGAVEQLAVHCRNLDVPLFQQGYGNDAATIAQFAVKQAAKDGQEVVLIDTAGRMQDNERLMQALAKLVSVNRPDLILFVGEALAGNDSVDQLTKFNQALMDWSGSEDPRLVDGIMLSKFDTVDDQVGTAVSLVYSSGLPIVFLGTGQHYTDLKKLNISAVVKALLR